MEDIFSHFGDIFGSEGSPFESFFGGNRGGGGRLSLIHISEPTRPY